MNQTIQSQQTNVANIQALYDAFMRGQVPALDFLAPNIEWEYGWTSSPMPWLQPLTGREQVARFFGILAEHLEFHSFTLNQILSGPKTVVALVSLDCTVRATGKHIVETDEPHIWHFDDEGRVFRFRHAADTLQHLQALQA